MSIKHSINSMKLSPLALAVALTVPAGTMMSASTNAQETAPPRGAAAKLLEEVVVTARKREEGAQDVPLSVTAFNSDRLDVLKELDERQSVVSKFYLATFTRCEVKPCAFNLSHYIASSRFDMSEKRNTGPSMQTYLSLIWQ